MKIDYLNLILEKGFKLPKEESHFDDRSVTQTYDNRKRNIIAVLNCALHGLSLKEEKTPLTLKGKNGDIYNLLVSEDSVVCKQINKNKKFVYGSKEFSLTKNDDGSYLFRRVLLDESGILVIDYNMAVPDNITRDNMQINGYDADTLTLLKKEVLPSDDLYEKSIDKFIEAFGILPDLKREICATGGTHKQGIQETDKTGDKTFDFPRAEEFIGNLPSFILLENYLRQRDFLGEMNNLKGLPIILKMSTNKE